MFSSQNSARNVVQDAKKWANRSLNLGNRHRTSLNFGDLVPAYWQHVLPGDKLKLDSAGVYKFLPLIAPAFTRMKIKTEWFYVPLKQISPVAHRSLQDFNPATTDYNELYSSMLNHDGFMSDLTISKSQQLKAYNGFPCIPSSWITQYLQSSSATTISDNIATFEGSTYGSADSFDSWRASDNSQFPQQEDIKCFTSMFRNAKLMSYMGLPNRLTTLAFNRDILMVGKKIFYVNPLTYSSSNTVEITSDNVTRYIYDYYYNLTFIPPIGYNDLTDTDLTHLTPFVHSGNSSTSYNISDLKSYEQLGILGRKHLFNLSNNGSTFTGFPVGSYSLIPLSSYSETPISLIPFQAYQKIFNDFYRDEKLQKDEIYYYPTLVFDPQTNKLINSYNWALSNLGSSSTLFGVDALLFSYYNNAHNVNLSTGRAIQFFNNLFGLRRRNRSKDIVNTCVPDTIFNGASYVATNPFNNTLFSRLSKFLLKKEMTGSTWAEWLNNFLGVKANDYLNDHVVYLGGSESVVSISENIQTSESSDVSAQGNRAGLANDFHSDSQIYFQVPDYGVIMCIVSAIPDDIVFNDGLDLRFERWSPWQFNLPDFQNIGFSALKNRNVVFSWVDSNSGVGGYFNDSNFGYQPFGIEHTFTKDIISCDMSKSLRFWTQNPDFNTDFYVIPHLNQVISNAWEASVPKLNYNISSIGLKFQPYGSDLKSQYYNNIFASTNDESGDHIVADMRFMVTCHRNTAFFTDAIENE